MARASSGVGFRLFLPTRIVAIPSYRGNWAISYSADSACPNHAISVPPPSSIRSPCSPARHVHIQRVVLEDHRDIAMPRDRPVTTRPAMRTSPAVTAPSPATIRSTVYFPQPEGSTSTTSSPGSTSRLTSRTATTPLGNPLRVHTALSWRCPCAVAGAGRAEWPVREAHRKALTTPAVDPTHDRKPAQRSQAGRSAGRSGQPDQHAARGWTNAAHTSSMILVGGLTEFCTSGQRCVIRRLGVLDAHGRD
jgi:hypothetical protein